MAAENKMRPTNASVDAFLAKAPERRQKEAKVLIAMMREITGHPPVLWGDSIIGFGSCHYKYESGREGDMPRLAFSPRKAKLTIYFQHGYQALEDLKNRLGKHKATVSCLYVNKWDDIDPTILRKMLEEEWKIGNRSTKPSTVEEYVRGVPEQTRPILQELRALVQEVLPDAEETLSYGIIGYRTEKKKRARVFISGFRDHVGVYPVPKDDALREELSPYIRGKGTLRFSLDRPLPTDLIRRIVAALVK